jgi:5-methylcytosine-specific restriction endonuclease McrA
MTPTEFRDRKFASGKPRNCWMCACVLTRGTASVDHLQPKSKGGKDRADNYKLACKPCNAARGNLVIPKRVRLELQGRPKPKTRDYSSLAAAIRANRAA